jgi:hypothetical protein
MMRSVRSIILIITGVAGSALSQPVALQTFAPPANFRIYPSAVSQTEVFVTRDPLNHSILFSSANTINLSSGFISEGIYISTDAGITWRGNDTCTGAPISFHRGDPGVVIDKSGNFIITRLGFQDGLFSHVSTDQGKTWTSQRTIAGERQDRASLSTDANSFSPYYGRTYTAYVELLPPFPLKVSMTTNGGTSWSTPASINNPSQRSQGAELSMGPDSTLYAIWAGVVPVSPYTEDFIGFARSSDGGVSWSVTENIIDMNGIQGVLSQKATIRVNGLPRIDVDRTVGPRRGWIYLVSAQKNLAPAGNDPDIIFHRSTDGGATWSSGKRITNDAANNGKIQYFPAIHVDDGGGINVIYYDDRNTTSDSAGVYLSRSTNGGDSWSDHPVSDHHFRPQSIGGLGQGYQGDNISLISTNGILIPLWMDNASGLYQIWSTRIPISSLVSVKQKNEIPTEFRLEQNFPNPFNPSTTLSFSLPAASLVRITLFDLLGREVEEIMNEERSAGNHSILFHADAVLASGIYYYRITAGEHSRIGKMILQK